MIRKHICFVLLSLIPLISLAQSNSLVIISETGQPFYLLLNHDSINKTGEHIVKASSLSAGWQHLYIKTIINNTSCELRDSILLSAKSKFVNKEFTYALNCPSGKLKLQFKSVSELSGPDQPPVPLAPKEAAPMIDNSIYGNLYQAKNNKPVFFSNYDRETSSCKTPLTDKEIKYAVNLFKKAPSEDSKLKYLEQIIELNCYTSAQIKELIELIQIDMDRLHLLKMAYSHISDKSNRSALVDVFKYQSMKEAYTDFLKEQTTIQQQKKLNCSEPIPNNEFEAILNKIKSTPYEYEKIKLAKKLMANTCVSTNQIKSMSSLFTHDRELLDFLKFTYFIITDKENIPSLENEFRFSDTKKEFSTFISKQHEQ